MNTMKVVYDHAEYTIDTESEDFVRVYSVIETLFPDVPDRKWKEMVCYALIDNSLTVRKLDGTYAEFLPPSLLLGVLFLWALTDDFDYYFALYNKLDAERKMKMEEDEDEDAI